jgi:hypothetical protein
MAKLGLLPGGCGRLHPRYVEWMMGFEAGWTDLDSEPSETPSSPKSPK